MSIPFLTQPKSAAAPTAGDDLVNKTYADGQVSSHTHPYLPLAGGTLTGFLTLHANPSSALHAAPKQYVDTAVSTHNSAAAAHSGVLAPLASPAFTGIPTAPTPSMDAYTTQLATTEYVRRQWQTDGVAPNGTDWDTITAPGLYRYLLQGVTHHLNGPPVNVYYHVQVYNYAGSGNCTQVAYPYTATSSGVWMRYRYGGVWAAWSRLVTDDILSWYLPLAGGTLTGNVTFSIGTEVKLPRLWSGASIEGLTAEPDADNIAALGGFTVRALSTATLNRPSVGTNHYGPLITAGRDWGWGSQTYINGHDGRFWYRAMGNSAWFPWRQVLDSDHTAAADPHPQYALDSDLALKAPLASPTFTGDVSITIGGESKFEVDQWGAAARTMFGVYPSANDNPIYENGSTQIGPGWISAHKENPNDPTYPLDVYSATYQGLKVGFYSGDYGEIVSDGFRWNGSRIIPIAELKTLVAASADFAAFKAAVAALPEYP